MPNQTVPIRNYDQDFPVFASARVESAVDGMLWLDDHGLKIGASKAFSCLVAPQEDDVVLYACSGNNEYFVVSIITRPGAQDATIELGGDTSILGRGKIHVASTESVSLTSDRINLVAGKLLHKADSATFTLRDTLFQGDTLNASMQSITLLSDRLFTMAKQAVARFQNYFRHSEQVDRVKSATMMRSSEGVYTVDAKQTVMNSQKDTRIDAERIHIG